MNHHESIGAARDLAPFIRERAREAEVARRPLDEVIEAVRDSGLFSMMVPKRYGGDELDIDTFFEVVLILSEADAAMGWLIGFYIEHAYWLAAYPESVQDEMYGDADHVLAPVTFNFAAGTATAADGGYRVNGRWSWGTGIVHATWVMAGCMATGADGNPAPMMFVLPRDEVETIDTWYISGMCGTGSLDFAIDDVFVPDERVLPFTDFLDGSGGIGKRFDAPLYSVPLVPILGFAAGLPCLGAARHARAAYAEQVKSKIDATGMVKGVGNFAFVAEASLTIDAAELLLRDVLADMMDKRSHASPEERSSWMTKISHAAFMCRDATQSIASLIGASGAMLDNPIQRCARDVSAAANHVIFERESRYGDHARQLLGQPITNPLV